MAAEPLLFPVTRRSTAQTHSAYDSVVKGFHSPCTCLLCDFVEASSREQVLKHVLETHNVVVADVQHVANLTGYFAHWKARLASGLTIQDIATTIDTSPAPATDSTARYYLLSDVLPEDRSLRERLQHDRLSMLLEVQQMEREALGPRQCLFCKLSCDTRDGLFQHLLDAHAFNVGLPDNLVFSSQYLDGLQAMLDRLQCLYCEKTFPSHTVLRGHMRKKHHFKINPKNKAWDVHYIVNFLELGKNWETLDDDGDGDLRDDPAAAPTLEWEEWVDSEGEDTRCIFCTHSSGEAAEIFEHMLVAHNFDFWALRRRKEMDFYQCVKAVNYLRRQAHLMQCPVCDVACTSMHDFTIHVEAQGHCALPEDDSVWNLPQYFFPTFENDPLLCVLDTLDADDDPSITTS